MIRDLRRMAASAARNGDYVRAVRLRAEANRRARAEPTTHPTPGAESEAWFCLHCAGEHLTHEGDCCCHAPSDEESAS